MSIRTIAVDWSGDARGGQGKIWLAEVREGVVARLKGDCSRDQVTAQLIDAARAGPEVIVGLDFAFSLPAWFLEGRQLESASELWQLVANEGETWLSRCEPPFWGRPGIPRPNLQEHHRLTEHDLKPVAGITAKSVFQIGGAGAVGTGSLRGMPFLLKLREAGYSIWPFDKTRLPLVIEIYPRILTGAVNKGNAEGRANYLATRFPELQREFASVAAFSEDAFDAVVSALVMDTNRDEIMSLQSESLKERQLEGRIWLPSSGVYLSHHRSLHMNAPKPPRPKRKQYDSSKTRVRPVMEALLAKQGDFVAPLLDLASGSSAGPWHQLDLSIKAHHWSPAEKSLRPPVSLLSWLIRNLDADARLVGRPEVVEPRRKLIARDPETIDQALGLLLSRGGKTKAWYVLEGPSSPDAVIETPDALVIIEGKRTERSSTTDTSFIKGRHQMLRHLDAAWEIRGNRSLYGIMIVSAIDNTGMMSDHWSEAARATTSIAAVASSLPHRSSDEQTAIANAFVGVTTWERIVQRFELDPACLPDTVENLSAS